MTKLDLGEFLESAFKNTQRGAVSHTAMAAVVKAFHYTFYTTLTVALYEPLHRSVYSMLWNALDNGVVEKHKNEEITNAT